MSSLLEKLDDIKWFLPTLAAEIDALEKTRTAHDRTRAGNAAGHLRNLAYDLHNVLVTYPVEDEPQ